MIAHGRPDWDREGLAAMMLIDEDTGMDTRLPAPWHLWLVGSLAVLWNGFGAMDYVLTHMGNEAYLSQMTEAQRNLFTNMPLWAEAGWAVAIWASVIGSALLLMRSKHAEQAFLASLVGMAVSFTHNLVVANGAEIMGMAGVIMTGVIVIIAVALYFYARSLARRGVLG